MLADIGACLRWKMLLLTKCRRGSTQLFHPNDLNAELVELIRTEVFQDPTSLFNENDDIEEEDL